MEKNIIGEFEKYWNKKEQIVNLEIESAKDLDASTVTNIKKYIENQSGAKKIECKKQINKDILGGVILRYEDKILDLSLKSKIEKLKNTIKK